MEFITIFHRKSRVMPSHSPVFASVYMLSVSSPPSSFSSLSSLSSFTGCCSTINHHCFNCTRSQSSRGIVFTNFFIVLNFISFFVLLTFTTVFLLVIIFITLYFIYFLLHSMLALALHRHLHFTHLLHLFHYRHHQLHYLLLHHSLLYSTTIVPISVIVSIILIISPCLHQCLHLLIFPTIFIFLFFSMFSVSSSSTMSSDQAALSLSSSLPLFSMSALGTVFNISFIFLSSPLPSLCSTSPQT